MLVTNCLSREKNVIRVLEREVWSLKSTSFLLPVVIQLKMLGFTLIVKGGEKEEKKGISKDGKKSWNLLEASVSGMSMEISVFALFLL